MVRKATVGRKTRETEINAALKIDGEGTSEIDTGIGFFTHMLETFAKHGSFDLEIKVKGDLEVDQHHTVEDTGIVLGQLFKEALNDKKGIKRAGFFICSMDEALVMTAVDISNRPYFFMNAGFKKEKVGKFSTELLEDFFRAFVTSFGASLHIAVIYGRSDHHKIEAVFKALGRSLKMACRIEEGRKDQTLSTKGML
ncbi:MAG: imidazoleglycerol-phosphate dehydratase HisB [Euryarchaeota archaeon]|nr:imidazoleglycerol-phosphate dehydratase HisB [Euryarchaeota archaeon]